ncbi:tyrosine-type recombinase/integrase [Pseudoalteromonas sp. Cnat2-41]|uniref:tyrosine-type recombinase/integrase n=1 Tax=unclassified Pseudoalteromonas TaxID=194690 RepID=UPI002285A762|nr:MULTISPECIES: tyrosine-type recombinase/integrase [unclassified Pseudoalteromonas]
MVFGQCQRRTQKLTSQYAARSPIKKELLEHLAIAYGRSGYIVPGTSPRNPITSHAINRYCARMRDAVNKEHGTSQFLLHDARRSVSTILNEHKVLPHVTEKMLGHSMRGVMAIYNKHDWIKEQRAGYDMYWQLIAKHVNTVYERQN